VLIVPFVIEILLAGTLISYFSFRYRQESVQELAYRLMETVGERTIQGLDTRLSAIHLINHLNGDALETGELKLQNYPLVSHHLLRQMQRFKNVHSIALASQDGKYINLYRSDQNGTLYLSLTEAVSRQSHYVLDNGGNRVARLIRPPVVNASWVETVKSGKGQSWRELYHFDFAGQEKTITAVDRLVDDQGNSQAFLAATTSLRSLYDVLGALKASPSGQTFVMDRSGQLIAASVPPKLKERLAPSPGLTLAENHSNWLIQQTAKYLNAQDKLATPGVLQKFSFALAGERHFAQVIPYKDGYGLDWLVITVVPESDFTAETHKGDQLALLIGGLTLVGVILLGWLTSSLIAQPILSLSHTSRELVLDKWDGQIASGTCITELEILADSFRKMAEHVQSSFDEVKVALQESEEKFSKIFRTTPNAIDIISLPDGRYLEVNESFLRTTGYSREEVIGRRVTDLGLIANPEQRQRFHQLIREMQTVHNLEFDYRTKSGELKTFLVASEILELDGKTCLLSISRDITERKHLERALQEAQQVAHIGSWEYNPATQVMFWSDEMFQIHGMEPPSQPLNLALALETLHPDDRPVHLALVERAIVEGKEYTSDLRIFRPDGSMRYVEVRGKPVLDGSGQLLRLIGTVLDITDRKQAEAAQRQSEECFRKAFDYATVGMSIVGIQGEFLQVNPSYCRMLGYTEAELLTRTFRDVTHPADLDADLKLMQQVLQGKASHYRMEKRYVCKDGTVIWGLLSTALIRDLHDQPVSFVSYVQDITVLHNNRSSSEYT
jgi:PAS domain S-box-containing protein